VEKMASREGYKSCGAKYRSAYKDLWKGEVTREALYRAIKESGGIDCLVAQWK
jgi:hypothetical protein